MHQLCREFVLAKRIAAGLIQIGQPLVLKQQKQESLTCFIRFYLTVVILSKYPNAKTAYKAVSGGYRKAKSLGYVKGEVWLMHNDKMYLIGGK